MLTALVGVARQRAGVADGAERLCRKAGLTVTARRPDQVAVMVGGRSVNLFVTTPSGRFVDFVAVSGYDAPAERVRPEVVVHLLVRNAKTTFGSWQLGERPNGNPHFSVHQTLLMAGLTPVAVAAVCVALSEEADNFDARLKRSGLLAGT